MWGDSMKAGMLAEPLVQQALLAEAAHIAGRNVSRSRTCLPKRLAQAGKIT